MDHIFFFVTVSVNPRIVVVKVFDCNVVLSKFELQSQYYVHFPTNTLRKGMNPLHTPNYELNSTTNVLQEWLWH